MSAYLQTTRTEFHRPVRETPEWGMGFNADDTLAFVGTGHFEPVGLSRTVGIYGTGGVRAWRWTGTIPRDESGEAQEPEIGWRLKANVQGKDREFDVMNATLAVAWTVELTEVS